MSHPLPGTFFTAAPDDDVAEDVEVALDRSDWVAFAIDELTPARLVFKAARLVLIELRALNTVEECAAIEEL